jgi:hypothetical protein
MHRETIYKNLLENQTVASYAVVKVITEPRPLSHRELLFLRLLYEHTSLSLSLTLVISGLDLHHSIGWKRRRASSTSKKDLPATYV